MIVLRNHDLILEDGFRSFEYIEIFSYVFAMHFFELNIEYIMIKKIKIV